MQTRLWAIDKVIKIERGLEDKHSTKGAIKKKFKWGTKTKISIKYILLKDVVVTFMTRFKVLSWNYGSRRCIIIHS